MAPLGAEGGDAVGVVPDGGEHLVGVLPVEGAPERTRPGVSLSLGATPTCCTGPAGVSTVTTMSRAML